MVLVLTLYPLRHIHIGLDLWDTGYNYANFEYMGMESMDPMWFFSTYLTSAIGHLFTLLPFGKTLLGMNLYTSLVVSAMAFAAYMFYTRVIKLPKFIVFFSEFITISLCWCPTAKLYDYFTYLFLMISTCCLYMGLTRKRLKWLFLAGIALGLNVFIRFSNLPEVVLIFAVWVFGILETMEKSKTETKEIKAREFKNGFKRTTIRTLACMMGYFVAVGGMLLYFGIRYGFGSYFAAIKRLFSMTSDASDYTAMSMVRTLISWYIEASYWLSRISVFAIGGILLCALGKHLDIQYGLNGRAGVYDSKKIKKVFGVRFSFLRLAYVFSVIFAVGSIAWLYKRKFSFGYYGEYGSILMPSAVLMLVTVLVCLYQIFKKGNLLADRLLAGLVLIIVLITPIGSNTGIMPLINNQFLVAPLLLINVWNLLRVPDGEGISRYNYNNPLIIRENNKRRKWYEIVWSYVSLFPVKAVLTVFCLLCFGQFIVFGSVFTFAESKNAWDAYYTVGSDKMMKGIRMDYNKASNYYDLYSFIHENGLADNELITFGDIPAISFYLQMPSAFNAWIDLASYNTSVLEQELIKVSEEVEEKSKAYPVVVIAKKYVDYLDLEVAEKIAADETLDDNIRKKAIKWKLITEFLEDNGYVLRHVNGTYAVLVAADED